MNTRESQKVTAEELNGSIRNELERINQHEEEIRTSKLTIGKTLAIAKRVLPHGGFEVLLKDVGLSKRTALNWRNTAVKESSEAPRKSDPEQSRLASIYP